MDMLQTIDVGLVVIDRDYRVQTVEQLHAKPQRSLRPRP